MLQQRGCYTVELSDGKKVPLIFRTWTFKRFCEINGDLTFDQFQNILTAGFTLSQFVSLMLCAAEYACRKENREFKHDDIEASEWIDDMGGMGGDGFVGMLAVITETFSDKGSNGEEKKIPAKAKK